MANKETNTGQLRFSCNSWHSVNLPTFISNQRDLMGAIMNIQWKKLTSLFLLIFFGSYSTLHAAACPCCTFQSILSSADFATHARAKPCCQKLAEAANEARPACCVKRTTGTDQACSNEETAPQQSTSDCSCCLQQSPFPTGNHFAGHPEIAAEFIHIEFPKISDSVESKITSIPVISPPPLIRRLAILSFWRN